MRENNNKLYLPSGYLNAEKVMSKKYPFIFGIGGRGIGKSFGFQRYLLNEFMESGKKFIYVRTTEDELFTACTAECNPFDADPIYEGRVTFSSISKHVKGINLDGTLCGVAIALTTFASVRGMNFKTYSFIWYDEFIREEHQHRIKKLGEALRHCYETVNRNRELDGEEPVRLIAMSNALDFTNDILMNFDLIEPIRSMKASGQEFYYDAYRGVMLIFPQHSPISGRKKETSLYKLGGSFEKMALKNEFVGYFEGNVASYNLKGFRPVAIYDDMCIYRSIGAMRFFYFSETRKGNFTEIYSDTTFERVQFMKRFYMLHDYYFQDKVKFESAKLENRFIELFKIK